ncbi:hypothetical protein ACFTS5_13015 [Nocardia sp. NPDC056952]|uniref:hypothetical protein n=1 Tax=Nocardia sp. NPDC056952 TaxID=3345979 RepID=UPI003631E478
MSIRTPERNVLPDEPRIRQVFRDVIAERLTDPRPPQAAMLFQSSVDPYWTDDRFFLGDFYDGFLHQDTCQPHTAEGVPVLAALAVDDRVPPQQRFRAISLLFSIATVADRRLGDCWPDTPRYADPGNEDRAREAVRSCTPDLLARWAPECPAVRLALAGLAVVFPTVSTLPALTPRLQGFVEQHPLGTDIGDYVRFILVFAAGNDDQTLATVESFTTAYWKSTSPGAPTPARTLHLLGQMLNRVGMGLTRSHSGG